MLNMDDPEEKKLVFIDTPIHCIDIKTGVGGLIKQIYQSVTIHTPWMGVKCNVPTHDGSVTGAEN